MPLMWAHAEYIKLLRSVHDGQVFDRISELVEWYRSSERRALEIWKPNRQVRSVRRGFTLRVQAPAPFRLRGLWTTGKPSKIRPPRESPSASVDIAIAATPRAPGRFTFLWTRDDRWEQRDYEVAVVDR